MNQKTNKTFIAFVLAAVLSIALAVFLRSSGAFGTNAVWKISNEGKWLFPLVTVAAIVDSVNPCAFSILLLTIAFLFSAGKARAGILKIGGTYILGLYVTYLLIGLGILKALMLFGVPHFMSKVGATILILFGLTELVGARFPSFPLKLKIPSVAHRPIAGLMQKATYPAAFGMGLLVGVCEFPCTGGPYLLVLGLLHDTATFAKGLSYLLYYNFVFVLPLIMILGVASNQRLLEKVQSWRKENLREAKLWTGAAMVGLGALMFFL